MEVLVTADAASAAALAATIVSASLRNAVRRRGRATVAFSGGSTPGLMLAELTEDDVPWSFVEVFQVDERIVPDGDARRNAALLDVLPVRRRQVHLMPVTAAHPVAAAGRYAARLPQRFDLVHLGLGDDGHTASWPPGDPVVRHHDAVAVSGEFNGTRRMTLTLAPVNAARKRLVLAPGHAKAGPVARWMLGDNALPISHVRRGATVVVLDSAAASSLPPPH